MLHIVWQGPQHGSSRIRLNQGVYFDCSWMKANIDLVSRTDNHLKGWHSQMKKNEGGGGGGRISSV